MTDALPLSGRCVVVTRPRHQSRPLCDALRELGARVVEAPAIRIEPPSDFQGLDEALSRIGSYDWVVFTSANAVEAFFERLEASFPRASLSSMRLAAIGPETAESLRQRGFEADVAPERFVAEEVFRAIAERESVSQKRFLLPRADIAREALPKLLRGEGAIVDVVVVYRTVPAEEEIGRAVELVERGEVDIVTFTSASTARSFMAAIEPHSLRRRAAAASIGPLTSNALRELGIEPAIEAEKFTTSGLVEAILRDVRALRES
ncbi:MAG: uroporphyrinogen-III synthase [Vicinamibacteria bacterium]